MVTIDLPVLEVIMKTKFKIGDSVKISKNIIEWYLSHEGQDSFYVNGNKQNAEQSKIHDECTVAMIILACNSKLTAEVIGIHHPNTELENYNVKFLNADFNICLEDLRKAK